MIKKFKKRFRSVTSLANWANKRMTFPMISAMDVKYFITKSADEKKHYHHLEGTYVPKDEE